MKIEIKYQSGSFLSYEPGRPSVALLEMFGMLKIATKPPQEGEGWIVDHIYTTPLGEAIIALLYDRLFSDFDQALDLEYLSPDAPSTFRPLFAPFVPEWKHELTLPAWDFRPGSYVSKVSLDRNLWRKIEISGHDVLDKLAWAILGAFDFDSDHLYQFSYPTLLGSVQHVNHSYMEEGPCRRCAAAGWTIDDLLV